MKVVFVFNTVYFFRYFDGVVRTLCDKGHTVKVVIGTGPVSINYTDRALCACLAETTCTYEDMLMRKGSWRWLLALMRELAGYANYFRPGHPAPTYASRWERNLSHHTRFVLRRPFVKRLLVRDKIRMVLRRAENLIPPARSITHWLVGNRPDVLVVTPFIFPNALDVEYIKAAIPLNIPTVVAVGSWDHLAGKGVFPFIPDLTLVWNKDMANDAMTIHDVPEEKILITGAPSFDFWFEAQPLLDRIAFCAQAGISPDQPFVVYLCSSKPIVGNNEPDFVREFSRTLSAHPATRDLNVLVRPYPALVSIWDGFTAKNVTIWPKEAEWPDIPMTKQNLYHTLYYSTAAVGVNTTAMLEAAVVNRPCLTIITEHYSASQVGRAHFRQMLDGNFLGVAHNFERAASILAAIVGGADSNAEKRRQFAQYFLRPHGVDQPVREIVVQAIELAALGKDAAQIEAKFTLTNLSNSTMLD